MSVKTFFGTVVSKKMLKTIVVASERVSKEQRTGKTVKSTKKFKVHCEDTSLVNLGDVVSFGECRPLSREKRTRFLKVLRKAAQLHDVSAEV